MQPVTAHRYVMTGSTQQVAHILWGEKDETGRGYYSWKVVEMMVVFHVNSVYFFEKV